MATQQVKIKVNNKNQVKFNVQPQKVKFNVGINGRPGKEGQTPEITIGQTVTLFPHEEARVELDKNSTKLNPILNFGIPQGIQGTPGKDGINGKDGAQGPQGLQGEIGPEGPMGPVGPIGPQGKSGVYYGEEEPIDEETVVWIDSDDNNYDTVEEITSNVMENIAPTLNEIQATANTAESIAKGRATGYVFNTVADLETWLQDEKNVANLVLGDNLYIKATDVPDYWWDGTTKQPLETQKVDLSEYIKNTDYATDTIGGIVKVNTSYGITMRSNNVLGISAASSTLIDAKTNQYRPIVPSNLDYAVKSVVGGHVALTQKEYDELETKDENTFYYIKKED